jgi:hypothetical protein
VPILYKYTVFLEVVKKLLKILKNSFTERIIDNSDDQGIDNRVNNDAS